MNKNKLKATLLTKTGLNRVLIRLSHEIMEKHTSIENLALIGIRTRGEVIAKRIIIFRGRIIIFKFGHALRIFLVH